MKIVHDILGNFYPIAKEIGTFLGRKICDVIDLAIPVDSSENVNSKQNVKFKNDHNHE